MKTKEELNALKNEVEALNDKLSTLTEEELTQVSGGGQAPENSDGIVGTCMAILKQMGLYPTEEEVRSLIEAGGSKLRDWALMRSGRNKMAYLIPVF